MVVDPEQGTVDSPLHPSQVSIVPTAPPALRRLHDLGFDLVIISNQPAAAKGKTTRANLDAVQADIVRRLESAGAVIRGSYICFHRAEDNCSCRKPKTGLLEQAFAAHPGPKEKSWMVGDGVTDILAGQRFRLKTAFLAAHKCDICHVFPAQEMTPPDVWTTDLKTFVDQLERSRS